MTRSIALIGAGAWGTALAVHLARRGELAVTLRARDPEQARAIAQARVNARYLPDVALPDALAVTADLDAAASAELLIVATPIAALPEVAGELAAAGARAPLVWLSKGLLSVAAGAAHPAGVALAHQVIAPTVAGARGRRLGTELRRGGRARTADGRRGRRDRRGARRRGSPRCCAPTRCARTKATTSPASRPAAR